MKNLFKFFFVYSIVFSLLFLLTHHPDHTSRVTSEEMKRFGKEYALKYISEVNKNIKEPFKRDFSFYQEAPYEIKVIISTSRGASLEFITKKFSQHPYQLTTDLPIEDAVYGKRFISPIPETYVYITKDEVNKAGLNWEDVVQKLDGKSWFFKKGSNAFRLNFKEHEKEITNLFGNNSLKIFLKEDKIRTPIVNTEHMKIFGRDLWNFILTKGSNERRFWTTKEARINAQEKFKSDFQNVYIESEEFRKFVATPELEKICRKLIDNNAKGVYKEEGGIWTFKKDFEEVFSVAKKHNIETGFASQLYDFLQKQHERDWFERHPVFSGFLWVIVSVIVVPLLKLIGAFMKVFVAKVKL